MTMALMTMAELALSIVTTLAWWGCQTVACSARVRGARAAAAFADSEKSAAADSGARAQSACAAAD